MNFLRSLVFVVALLFCADAYAQCGPYEYMTPSRGFGVGVGVGVCGPPRIIRPCPSCGEYHGINTSQPMPSRPPITVIPPSPDVDPGDIPPYLPPDIKIPIPGEDDLPPSPVTPPTHDHKEIEDKIKALEDRLVPVEKVTIEIKEQVTEQRDIVLNVEQKVIDIMDLPPAKCDEDAIVDKVYERVKTDLTGIEDRLNTSLGKINERLDNLPQMPTVEAIVDAVVIRLGELDDADKKGPLLLYYTVPGDPLCKRTDEMAIALRKGGYPIVIHRLHPTSVLVESVPRVFNTRTDEETIGTSNVITLFSSLTL